MLKRKESRLVCEDDIRPDALTGMVYSQYEPVPRDLVEWKQEVFRTGDASQDSDASHDVLTVLLRGNRPRRYSSSRR